MSRTFLSDIGLVYAAAVWGSTFFLVKDALGGINPVAMVAYRFLLAALVLGAVALALGRPLWRNFRYGLVLGMIIGTLYVTQTIGLQYTSAANSGFITGLFILFVPVFGYLFFRRLPSRRRLAAVAISIAGLWLLTGGLWRMNLGDALTLAAAATYALHIIFTDRFVRESDPFTLTFQQFLVVGVGSLLVAAFFSQPLSATPGAWWVVLFLALFPTASAFLIQTAAQRHTSPVKVALIFALEPVFAAAFAWTLGGESFVPVQAIGGLLIVAGMMMAELPD